MFLLLLAGLNLQKVYKITVDDYEIFHYHSPDFSVSDDGVIAVVDFREGRLLLLDGPKGDPLWCGCAGKGPGEFDSLDKVTWFKPEQVFLAFDSGNGRMSAWSRKGELLREVKLGNGSFFGAGITHGRTIFSKYTYMTKSLKGYRKEVLVMASPEQDPRMVWRYSPPPGSFSNLGSKKRPIVIDTPWDRVVCLGVGSDFAAVWDIGSTKILLFDAMGKPLDVTIKIPKKHKLITAAQKNDFIENIKSEETRTLFRAKSEIPEFWPLVRRIRVDAKNRIWVFGYAARPVDPWPVLIFNREGKRLLEATIPHLPHQIGDEQLYWIRTDENEEHHLEAFTYHLN